jgi:hypothetical protein
VPGGRRRATDPVSAVSPGVAATSGANGAAGASNGEKANGAGGDGAEEREGADQPVPVGGEVR